MSYINPNAQTNLRLPQGLKEWLRVKAKEEQRSLTGEIIYRLEVSRQADQQTTQQKGHQQ